MLQKNKIKFNLSLYISISPSSNFLYIISDHYQRPSMFKETARLLQELQVKMKIPVNLTLLVLWFWNEIYTSYAWFNSIWISYCYWTMRIRTNHEVVNKAGAFDEIWRKIQKGLYIWVNVTGPQFKQPSLNSGSDPLHVNYMYYCLVVLMII